MTRRRFDNLDTDRQKRLFDCAAEEFAAHGYDGASLNRILDRSGMSKSSFYYYFEDKADLFTTLIERTLVALLSEIGGFDPVTPGAETFWTSFEDLYRRVVAVCERKPWLMKLGSMFYQLRALPGGEASTGRFFQAVRDWIDVIVTRGQMLGLIRRDLPQELLIDMTLALLVSLDRWLVTRWSTLSASDKAAIPSQHIDLFRRLLETGATSDAI